MTPDELTEQVAANAAFWVRPYVGYLDSRGLFWRPPAKGYGEICVLETDDVCLALVRVAEALGMDLEFRRAALVYPHLNVWLRPKGQVIGAWLATKGV